MSVFRLIANLSLNTIGFRRGLAEAERGMMGWTQRQAHMIRTHIGGALSVAGVIMGARAIARFASDITDLAEQLGTTVEQLRTMEEVAARAGARIEDLRTFLTQLARVRQAALTGQQESLGLFSALGIGREELLRANVVDLFRKVGAIIRTTDFGPDESALMIKLFGRGGLKALPILRSALLEQPAGAFLRSEDVRAVDEASDRIGGWWRNIRDLATTGVGSLLRMADVAVDFWTDLIMGHRQSADQIAAQQPVERRPARIPWEALRGRQPPATIEERESARIIGPMLTSLQEVGAMTQQPVIIEARTHTRLLSQIERNTRPESIDAMEEAF